MKIKINWWFVGVTLFVLFLVLILWIYIPFYQDIKELQDSVLRYSFENGPLKPPLGSNEYVSVWGAFGDFIGGTLNPFFTFFSVLGLLYTIHQNNKTLEINKEEMRLSREALKQSATAQTEMEKTQKLQQFDGILTIMLSKLREFEEKIGLDKIESDYELFFKKINNNVDLFGCARNIFDKNIYIDYFALICGTNKLIKDLNFEDIYLKDKYLNLLSLVVGQKK